MTRWRAGEKKPIGPPCKECGEPIDYAKQYGCPAGFNDCEHSPVAISVVEERWYDTVLKWFRLERVKIHILRDDKRVFRFTFLWKIP